MQQRIRTFVDRGQLGPFANAYWGHPAYRLPPEANLMAVAHYLEALDWQREFIKIHAMLGGKNPHLQSFLVGGMATPVDPNQQAALNVHSIEALKGYVQKARAFVHEVYIPDLLAIAGFYKEWAGYGENIGNFLVYGDYPARDSRDDPGFFLPGGVIVGRDLSHVQDFHPEKVTEHVKHSWYQYPGGDDRGLHPSVGETIPHYTGPNPPYERLHTDGKYSWLKAPRYDGKAMEVGPLARMLVAYARGRQDVKAAVHGVLAHLGVGPETLFSTLGRVAARGIETQLLADKMGDWVDRARRQHGPGGPAHRRQQQVGSVELAGGLHGSRLPRGAPRSAGPLGAHQAWRHRPLPVRRAEHVERRAPRRPRPPGPLRGGPVALARGEPRAAPRDPAHHPLLRSVHGVRRPRAGRGRGGGHPCEGAMSAASTWARRLERWAPWRARPGEVVTEETLAPLRVPHESVAAERIYVWDLMVRATHWTIAFAIVVLAVTGFYIGDPSFVGNPATTGAFLMAKVKLVHAYAAVAFTLAVGARLAWMFVGTQYARWDQLVPLAPERRKKLRGTLSFYLFVRRRPPLSVGHNPLAGATYLAVFGLYLVMIFTGLALYSVDAGLHSPTRLFAWVLALVGGPQVARYVHHVTMWLLLGFIVHHIFSGILMSQVEKNGTIDSIFSGYKHIPRPDLSGALSTTRQDEEQSEALDD